MKHTNFRSQFYLDRSQRIGIFFLICLMAGSIGLNHFVDFNESPSFNLNSPELLIAQKTIDSLKKLKIEDRKPKIYPFNPNFITDHKAYVLGMNPAEFDRLKSFREGGKWINSTVDFHRVTQVSDSLLNHISPYFKFPEWVSKPRSKRTYSEPVVYAGPKKDLNTATTEDLQEVRGIGSVLSARIISYRQQLGGFVHMSQLYEVWGLRPEVIDRLGERFEVNGSEEITKLSINTSSASDIATIPGISFDLAKEIWEFVYLRGGISDLNELEKIDRITPRKLQLIELYLFAE